MGRAGGRGGGCVVWDVRPEGRGWRDGVGGGGRRVRAWERQCGEVRVSVEGPGGIGEGVGGLVGGSSADEEKEQIGHKMTGRPSMRVIEAPCQAEEAGAETSGNCTNHSRIESLRHIAQGR